VYCKVVEDLRAAFDRRSGLFTSRLRLERDFHFLALTLAAVLYSGFLAMCRRQVRHLVRNVDLRCMPHSSGRSNSKRNRRIFGFGGRMAFSRGHRQRSPNSAALTVGPCYSTSLPSRAKLKKVDQHYPTNELRVRRKEAAAYADNAATEFIKFERNSAGMPGEMS
jgi:hypothetical protein